MDQSSQLIKLARMGQRNVHMRGALHHAREEQLRQQAEAEVRKAAIAEWEESEGLKAAARANVNHADEDAVSFVAHVPLPDVKEIEQAVLLKKKKDLMARYASASLQKDEEEAKVRTHCKLHKPPPIPL